MNVVGYVRVSTGRQVERGLSLPDQERTLREWAKANGHRLVAVYADPGLSGATPLDARTGLPEALAALRDRTAAGLVVLRIDRLARDLMVQEQVIADVRRWGCEVFSTSAAENDSLRDDTNDPARKLVRQMLGAVAEYERAMVAMRLMHGRRRKSERGGFAYGSPPLGQRAEAGELVPEPSEAATVSRIRELHAEGKSLRQIADTLTAEGRRTKRGGHWHPPTVARVLSRARSLAA